MAVAHLEVTHRRPFAFDYERIDGTRHFSVDPSHPANARIVDLDTAARDANGEVRFVRSQGDVYRDESGRPRRLFGTLQDITERKLAEKRLLAQQAVTQILSVAATLDEASAWILRQGRLSGPPMNLPRMRSRTTGARRWPRST